MKKTKKVVISLLLFVITPFSVFGAISSDAVLSEIVSGNGVSSLTNAFTVGSGSNRVLYCLVYNGDGDTDTSLTFDSVSFTQGGKKTIPNGSTLYDYYLKNPNQGTHNIVSTRSSNTNRIRFSCVSYSGVSQQNPSREDGYKETTLNTQTHSTTSNPPSQSWITALVYGQATDMSSGLGTVRLTTGTNLTDLFEDSGNPISGGNETLNFVQSGVDIFDSILYVFEPATSSGSSISTEESTSTQVFYKDWMLVNTIEIFLLAFVPMGIGFSLLKPEAKKYD